MDRRSKETDCKGLWNFLKIGSPVRSLLIVLLSLSHLTVVIARKDKRTQ